MSLLAATNFCDVMFKVLSQHYKDKSFEVYGFDVPKVKRLLPSNYPTVTATEVFSDNVFELVDGSLLILEYESSPIAKDFLKYCKYVINALEREHEEDNKIRNVTIGVVYTGDVKTAPAVFDVGALRIQVQQVFLSKFDTAVLYAELEAKINSGEVLTDDEVMKLIILPLTQSDKARKQRLIEDTIDLAKQIHDEAKQMFTVAGILTATNKFIDREYSEMVKGWIKMTKVARLFEEEKIEAVNKAINETVLATSKKERTQFASAMLAEGEDILKIMKFTKLTRSEIEALLAPESA